MKTNHQTKSNATIHPGEFGVLFSWYQEISAAFSNDVCENYPGEFKDKLATLLQTFADETNFAWTPRKMESLFPQLVELFSSREFSLQLLMELLCDAWKVLRKRSGMASPSPMSCERLTKCFAAIYRRQVIASIAPYAERISAEIDAMPITVLIKDDITRFYE